ncbi:unnamed protein product [Cuscuta campestris]|uniref:Uncharacterized protein n=1 Tax=Cuscuta campestris TaxID=132261 RepID=A0A484M474_9ASTE|nr:unnamed protein product [Cuscuta campestris]
MYGLDTGTEDVERTAFRKAEKKYKLYYDSSRKKKQPIPVDLSEVIDFKSIAESYAKNVELPAGISVLQCDFGRPVFCLESHPGVLSLSSGSLYTAYSEVVGVVACGIQCLT